jgi:hypothetical protein
MYSGFKMMVWRVRFIRLRYVLLCFLHIYLLRFQEEACCSRKKQILVLLFSHKNEPTEQIVQWVTTDQIC